MWIIEQGCKHWPLSDWKNWLGSLVYYLVFCIFWSCAPVCAQSFKRYLETGLQRYYLDQFLWNVSSLVSSSLPNKQKRIPILIFLPI